MDCLDGPGGSLTDKAEREGWQVCGLIGLGCFQDEEHPALALTQDASGCAAGLYTHPEFFCAHWKPKEGEG
jgi:hypothetical protein